MMIKADIPPWQIILLHMQEDLNLIKEKFLVVGDGLETDDPFIQLINKIESNVEKLYHYMQQQSESSVEIAGEEDYENLLDHITL
jgi:hypothetical protein